jgi:hypothetical protein
MESAIIKIDRGRDVKREPIKVNKRTGFYPLNLDLRRMRVGFTEVLLALSIFSV